MISIHFWSLIFVLLGFSQPATVIDSQDLQKYVFESRHMGTDFKVMIYSDVDSLAQNASSAAFREIENLNGMMSDYLEKSELNQLTDQSEPGSWVRVSPDLFVVLNEAMRISENTGGLFDVTVGPMTKSWRAIRRMPDPQLPKDSIMTELKERVGYENIRLNQQTKSVKLLRSDMELDLGGIAKGYAAEKALRVINDFGIDIALIDAGGDVTLGNSPPDREYWTVAIPRQTGERSTDLLQLRAENRTIATSGDLYQFLKIGGIQYSHILNPKTGLGSTRKIQSTVISHSAMEADAYASVLALTEPEEGLQMIEDLPDTEAVITFLEDDGTTITLQTSGVKNYFFE